MHDPDGERPGAAHRSWLRFWGSDRQSSVKLARLPVSGEHRMLRRMWRGLLGMLAVWGVGAIALRATLIPAQVCPPLSSAGAFDGAKEATGWAARAQRADGTFLYEYDANRDIDLGGYNIVRHAGVVMALYMFAAEAGDSSVLPAADRGLDYMTRHMLRRDGWAAFQGFAGQDPQLGASALMVAGLAQRRTATSDPQFDDLMREVGRHIRVMQGTDGSFSATWLLATGGPDPSDRSKYSTGEAFWALTLMHRLFPGEGWDAPARAVADYLSLHRDEVEGFDFPPWADQWAAYGLAEMATWPLNDANIRYARSLAQRFGFLVRVESQRQRNWWSDLVRGPQVRGAGTGTWAEGLDSLYRLASIDPRMADMRDKLGERAACAAGILAERQVSESEASQYGVPGIAQGAWITNGVTRMDDQQHALSALVRAAAILDELRARQ